MTPIETCYPFACSLVVAFGALIGLAFSLTCLAVGMFFAHRDRIARITQVEREAH